MNIENLNYTKNKLFSAKRSTLTQLNSAGESDAFPNDICIWETGDILKIWN